jgi:hypothetical protein
MKYRLLTLVVLPVFLVLLISGVAILRMPP